MLLAHFGHPHFGAPAGSWSLVLLLALLVAAAGLSWWALRTPGAGDGGGNADAEG